VASGGALSEAQAVGSTADQSSVEISRSSGPAGTVIQGGGHCPALNAAGQSLAGVDITLLSSPGAVTSPSFSADGRFEAPLHVPEGALAGPAVVQMACRYQGGSAELQVRRDFLITSGEQPAAAGLFIAPSASSPGTIVRIVGKCPAFGPAGDELRTVQVRLAAGSADQPTLTPSVTSEGRYVTMLAIPREMPGGSFNVQAACFYGTNATPAFLFRQVLGITAH
jgi:hypothetical protein